MVDSYKEMFWDFKIMFAAKMTQSVSKRTEMHIKIKIRTMDVCGCSLVEEYLPYNIHHKHIPTHITKEKKKPGKFTSSH